MPSAALVTMRCCSSFFLFFLRVAASHDPPRKGGLSLSFFLLFFPLSFLLTFRFLQPTQNRKGEPCGVDVLGEQGDPQRVLA
jgi:hypothetical protein